MSHIGRNCVDCREGGLKMVSKAFYLPKANPSKPLGDDAHFVLDNAIGVADGGSGWSKNGVDTGEYARELMTTTTYAILDDRRGVVNLRKVLKTAFSNTKAKGSSTVFILRLYGRYLHSITVGDSRFMLFRRNEFQCVSEVQGRCLNHPFQLGNLKGYYTPNCATEMKVAVRDRDIVVAGTDGLFDNLYASEIEQILKKDIAEGGASSLEDLARAIAERARCNSLDMASQEAGDNHRIGGKHDDITVVVGLVVKTD